MYFPGTSPAPATGVAKLKLKGGTHVIATKAGYAAGAATVR